MKYQRTTTSGKKDIGIWKSEFVTKTQFLCYCYTWATRSQSRTSNVVQMLPSLFFLVFSDIYILSTRRRSVKYLMHIKRVPKPFLERPDELIMWHFPWYILVKNMKALKFFYEMQNLREPILRFIKFKVSRVPLWMRHAHIFFFKAGSLRTTTVFFLVSSVKFH